MRILRHWVLVCAVWAIVGTSNTLAQDVLPDPNVVQASHLFHKSEPAGCPDVKVIVEMAPAEGTKKSDPSTPAPAPKCAERCCLFHKHARGVQGGVQGAVGSIIYTPAMINFNQGSSGTTSGNFGASVDLSGLRNVHEMEMHLATYGAQRAAQEAAKEHMDQALSRLQDNLQKVGAGSGKFGAGAGADTSLNAQLKKLDDRLKNLEDMVQAHHDAIAILVQLAPKPLARGKIKSVAAMQLVLTDSTGNDMTFQVPDKVPVQINNKVSELKELKSGDTVIVVYEKTDDKLTATLIRCDRN